jgi:hypothetical protein
MHTEKSQNKALFQKTSFFKAFINNPTRSLYESGSQRSLGVNLSEVHPKNICLMNHQYYGVVHVEK